MYTSPSPLPRRAPLRLPFSVHIRTLFFLFLSLFSGAPRRTHPVGAGVCPSVCPAVAPFSHLVGAGVPDGPHRFSSTLPAGIFRAPARQPFAHGGKRMQKRRQRPMVFGIPFVRLQSRRKKVPQRIACTSIPAAAPAHHAKTFFSRAVQGMCFTSYIILYSAARRAAPIYHSPPENATRSRVPRLNAPNGNTPPTLISPCLRSRTLRRGRRPRRPASAHLRIPVHSRLSLRRGRRPRRPASAHLRIPAHSRLSLRRGRRPRRPVFRSPIAGCTRVLHLCLRQPYFFQQRKKYGKERRQKPTVFGFPFSDCNCIIKRSHNESPVLLSPLPLPRAAG